MYNEYYSRNKLEAKMQYKIPVGKINKIANLFG